MTGGREGAPVRLRWPVLHVARASVIVALLLSVAAPRVAWAHGALKRASPASGARLDSLPREIRLTFNERVELAFARLALLGPGGDTVALGPIESVAGDGRELRVSIAGALREGTYRVHWRVAGRDGHPVRGDYSFTIAPGARGLADAAPAAENHGHHAPATMPAAAPDPDFDAGSPAYVIARWLTFVAALVVIGTVAFRFAVAGRLADVPGEPFRPAALSRVAMLGIVSGLALLGTSVARLAAQSLAMHGAGDMFAPATVGAMIAGTLWGTAWVLQVGATILALIGFSLARGGVRAGWMVSGVAAGGIALSMSLAGHAPAVADRPAVAVMVDSVHILGAAGWLGSLFVLLTVGLGQRLEEPAPDRVARAAAIVNAFSPAALVFAGVVVTTGAVSAGLHLGSVAALWGSTYGRALLLKLAILSIVAGIGAYNWLRVRPALGEERGVRRLQRSGGMELLVGLAVLGATAVLVATPTPME